MTREITVWKKNEDGSKGDYVTKKYCETDAECYDWFHDNYGEAEYTYEKIG